jgi:hypothetical protein
MVKRFFGLSLVRGIESFSNDWIQIEQKPTIEEAVDTDCDFIVCTLEEGKALLNGTLIPPLLIVADQTKQDGCELAALFDAWVVQDEKVFDSISQVCRQSEKEIERIKRLRYELKEKTKSNFVSRINIENLDLIKSKMQHSTDEIRKIFKNEIDNMRSVYEELEETKKMIASNRDDEKTVISRSIVHTQDILDKTSEIIKNMHGFVSILQCEDRITQMIDGIIKVTQTQLLNDTQIDEDAKQELISSMLSCYTIQEQRDMLVGKEVDKDGCENTEAEDEEFTLF